MKVNCPDTRSQVSRFGGTFQWDKIRFLWDVIGIPYIFLKKTVSLYVKNIFFLETAKFVGHCPWTSPHVYKPARSTWPTNAEANVFYTSLPHKQTAIDAQQSTPRMSPVECLSEFNIPRSFRHYVSAGSHDRNHASGSRQKGI